MESSLHTRLEKINIYAILYVVFMLNLVDAMLTLVWIKLGIAVEANPIMAYMLSAGDGWFIAIKIIAIAVACTILSSLKRYRLAKIVAISACALYVAITLLHLWGIWIAGSMIL